MDKHTTRICPTCDKSFPVEPRHPDVRFCSRECFVQSKHETRICACGKSFNVKNSSPNKYCSAECGFKFRPKREANPAKKLTYDCVVCGKQFESWSYRNSTCCSRKCASSLSAGVPKPTARKLENFRTIYCEVCNKEYIVHKVFCENGRTSRFCSMKCRSVWMSENKRGANNPMFSGGTKYPDRGANWNIQRKAAFRRDGGRCQICRTADRKRRISVHHITPYRVFAGDYLAANQLLNLITLCQKCHNRVERHKLPCPKPLF